MIFTTSTFYLIKSSKSFQEISDSLAQDLTDKFAVEQRDSPKGFLGNLTQKFAGSRQKYLYIKKNAFRGALLRIFDHKSDVYICVEDYIPNPFVKILWKNTGILLRPLFRLFFGKKEELNDAIFFSINNRFETQEEA
jgi:hypothetical protein